MCKIVLFKFRCWRTPYYLLGLDLYPFEVGIAGLLSTKLKCFTLIETAITRIEYLILVTYITWDFKLCPSWTLLFMSEEVLLEERFNSQFHVHKEFSELESSDNRQVWEGKPLPTLLHQWKPIAHISAFGLHFVAALQCRQRLKRSFNLFYLFWGSDILQKWKPCVQVYNLNSGPCSVGTKHLNKQPK